MKNVLNINSGYIFWSSEQVKYDVFKSKSRGWISLLVPVIIVYTVEYFKKHNYQSNHPKSENIDRTEFKNGIQNIVVLEMAKSGHF